MSPNAFSSVHKPVKVSAGPPPAVYATRAWPAGRGSRSALRPSPTAHASAKPRPAGPFLCPCLRPCLHTNRPLYSPLAHRACICRAAPSEHTNGRARPSYRDPQCIARRPGTEQTALALPPERTRRNWPWNNPGLGASHHHEATCSPGRYPRVHVSHFNSKQA